MSKRSAKIVLSLVLALAFLTSMTACGSGNTATTSTTAQTAAATQQVTATTAAKEPVTINFITYNAWGTAQETYTLPISTYEKATGNKVNMQLYPDDQFKSILKTKLAAGDVPDVYADSMENTDPLVNQVITLDGPWTTQIRPGIAGYDTRKDNGKWFIAPMGTVSYLGIIYNKEIFQKAGVTLPLKTYSDFVAACKAIQKTGVAPLQISNKDGNSGVLYLVGGHYPYEDQKDLAGNIATNKTKFSDNTEIVQSFQRMADLKPYLKSDFASCDGLTALKQVIEGQVAMFANGSWCYGIYNTAKDFANDKDKLSNLGMMPFTLGDNNEVAVQTHANSGWLVPTASKHKQEAMDLINTAETPDVINALAQKAPGVYPLNVDTPRTPWESEMLGYINSASLQIRNQAPDEYLNPFGIDFNGSSDAIKAIFLGSPVKTALDGWYKQMSDSNKSKRNTGW